jgi:hypothetical protein
MTPRSASMSVTRSAHASLTLSPAPYITIAMARYIGLLIAPSSFAISVPLRTTGTFTGCLGHDIHATTSGRPSVTAYK